MSSTSSRTDRLWLRLRGRIGRNELGLLGAFIVVVVLTAIFDGQHAYLRQPKLSGQVVLRQTVMLGIFALGSAIVIIAGGIDLSSGSMIAFCGTICATILLLLAPNVMQNPFDAQGNKVPLDAGVIAAAVLGTIAVAFLIGSFHAWLITQLELPPFIATLGSLVGLRSLARILTNRVTRGNTQIEIFDDGFRYLSTSVWIPAIIFITLALAAAVLMDRTVLGRHLYALGGNEEAARLSGIRTNHLKWFAYSLSAMLAGIAGILYIGDQGVAAPEQLAHGYELNAIAAAVVGGCSLQGGRGTITGTLLGVLFLRTIIDAVSKLIHVGSDLYEGAIVGVVVVLAVAVNRLRRT